MCAICSDTSGNGHRLKNIGPVRHRMEHFNPRLTGGNIRGFKGSTCHRKSGYDLQKKITMILSRMQTSVFELLTCAVWGCPECYVMQERGTAIKARRGN